MYLLDPYKKVSYRRKMAKPDSFTLVELLVVMAIIIILAAVTVGAGNMVIRMAKRAKAFNVANQIQTACLAYYTDYSLYPIPSDMVSGTPSDMAIGAGLIAADATHWKNLTWALCGNINPAYPIGGTVVSTVSNTRAIAYLNLNLADVEHSSPPAASDTGIPLNPIHPTAWGTYFNIAMDGSYDGILPTTGATGGTATGAITNFSQPTMPTMAITSAVAVWANCNYNTATNNTAYVHTF